MAHIKFDPFEVVLLLAVSHAIVRADSLYVTLALCVFLWFAMSFYERWQNWRRRRPIQRIRR